MVFNVAKSKFNAEKMTYSSECENIQWYTYIIGYITLSEISSQGLPLGPPRAPVGCTQAVVH